MKLDTSEFRQALVVAEDSARQAGDLLRAALATQVSFEHKGEVDLVTRLDYEAERLIVGRIHAAFPEHAILAEEQTHPASRFPVRWIIDPLDGTTNFVHGLPQFAVSIALEVEGSLVLGVIYDPNRDELFSAVVHGGSRRNGQPIRVSSARCLDESLLGTGFPYDRRRFPEVYLRYCDAFLRRSRGIRRAGAATLDLAWVACGRLDAFWEFKLQPWDIAAGMLLIREAGGVVVSRRGAEASVEGTEIVAGPESVVAEMIGVMATIPPPPGT